MGWNTDRRPCWVVLAIVHRAFSIPMPHLCAKSTAFSFGPLSLAVQMLETLTLSASAVPKSCTRSFSFGNDVVFSEVSKVKMNWRLCPISTGMGASQTSPLLCKRASSWCLKVSEWGFHLGDSHVSSILGHISNSSIKGLWVGI